VHLHSNAGAEMTAVIRGLGVYPANMQRNLNVFNGAWCSVSGCASPCPKPGMGASRPTPCFSGMPIKAWNSRKAAIFAPNSTVMLSLAPSHTAQREACFSTGLASGPAGRDPGKRLGL